LWCRWQYIWMKGTHLMNTENCFKNSLVIAIMFRVALGNWGKQYKIHPGNMYNILLYIYKLATTALSLMHAGYGYPTCRKVGSTPMLAQCYLATCHGK
jgi:hypothetical protein